MASACCSADPVLHQLQAPQGSPFPDNPSAERIIARWDPDIRRASRAAEKSYVTRSAVSDDFAQDARVRVLRVLHQNRSAPEPFVRKVISNSVRNSVRCELPHLTQVDRLVVVGQDEQENQGTHPRPSLADGPDPLVTRFVARWVAGLPTKLQRIYELLYVRDLAQREAAAVLGVSQPRVFELHAELLRRGKEALAPVAA